MGSFTTDVCLFRIGLGNENAQVQTPCMHVPSMYMVNREPYTFQWGIGKRLCFRPPYRGDGSIASLAWQYGTSHGNLTQGAGYPGFWISSIRGGRNPCMRSRLAGQVAQSHETKCRDSAIHGSKDEEQGKRC